MKQEDLIAAAEDLNKLLFDAEHKDEGWLNAEDPVEKLQKKMKQASLWLLVSDKLETNTISVLKQMNWKETDFSKLAESQNPIPAFTKFGILPKDPPKKKKPKEKAPMEGYMEEPKPKKEKLGPSAYGMAIAVMGVTPTMPLHTLYDVMKEKKYDLAETGNSIKTAHSIFKKVYTLLKNNGFIIKDK